MSDVTVRAARPDDLDRIIAIIYDEPQRDLLGVVPDPRKARAIGALITRGGLELKVDRAVVAVAGGQAVGVMETRRPSEEMHVSLPALLRVLAGGTAIIGPSGLWRFVRYRRARSRVEMSRAPGSFYVAELDVHPDHRNRGIGGVLLRHAEEHARAGGFAQMSLTTSTINPAQHLYTRHGYRIVETRLDAAYERMTGIPGRVLMVKELT